MDASLSYFEYQCDCGRHSKSEWGNAFGAKSGAEAHVHKRHETPAKVKVICYVNRKRGKVVQEIEIVPQTVKRHIPKIPAPPSPTEP